jgi:hypothetical protein
VVKAVNNAPEYADLRRVYASRVAAQWYRDRSRTKHTAYRAIIDSGNVSRWPSRTPWSPREVFDRYVDSYRKGEFRVTHKTRIGNTIYTNLYVFGGVDFTNPPRSSVSDATFSRDYPKLAGTVVGSLGAPSSDGDHVWLGGESTDIPLATVSTPAPVAGP